MKNILDRCSGVTCDRHVDSSLLVGSSCEPTATFKQAEAADRWASSTCLLFQSLTLQLEAQKVQVQGRDQVTRDK